MIQQIFDLALGRAFAPDPLDSTVALSRRFPERTVLALSVYKDGMEALPLTFTGEGATFGAAEFFSAGTEDAEAEWLHKTAERHQATHCVINLTTGYSAVLSNRTRRPESDEEGLLLMRDNPERLLGESPAPGTRPSIAYHPTHNFAVVFSHKDHDLQAVAGLASKAELAVARIQCGMSSALVYVLDHCWDELGGDADLLLIDRASILHLPVNANGLGRPLFDVGLKETALKQALEERLGRLKPQGRVAIIDSSGQNVAAQVRARFPEMTVVELLKDEPQPFLRAICIDRPRLGYDLYPLDRIARPYAPAGLHFVPILFWSALAASIALIGTNTWRARAAEGQTANLQRQAKQFGDGMTHQVALRHELDAHAKTATAMCDWLLISPSTQSLLTALTGEIESATNQALKENKSVAQLDSLSITRQEGQPQMRLVLVVFGDAPAANRIFQRISALFGRLGYSTIDLKQTLIPQGFRYEHLLSIPQTTTG